MANSEMVTITCTFRKPWVYFALGCYLLKLERLGNWAFERGTRVTTS